jgi:uncharacterized protein YvpB
VSLNIVETGGFPIKKVLIAIVVLGILLFLKITFHYSGNQADRSLNSIKPSPLIQREIVLAEKQPIPAIFDSHLLNVQQINQMTPPRLYNGCEVTSLAMILHYSGYSVTKNELAAKIKTVPFTYKNGLRGNPNAGFVGDIVNGPGYGVYNGPIYELAKEYAGEKAVNLTNHPFLELLKKVSANQPVWVITTASFAPVSDFIKWPTPQGTMDITFSEHSVVITGYDRNYIYLNDPYGFKNRKVNRTSFEKSWEQMGRQAIVIKN